MMLRALYPPKPEPQGPAHPADAAVAIELTSLELLCETAERPELFGPIRELARVAFDRGQIVAKQEAIKVLEGKSCRT